MNSLMESAYSRARKRAATSTPPTTARLMYSRLFETRAMAHHRWLQESGNDECLKCRTITSLALRLRRSSCTIGGSVMPEQATLKRARQDKRAGKAPTTQAGEFVREEIHHVREGKHGARSTKQAIAIGLSKARRAGVELPPPSGNANARTKQSAKAASRAGARRRRP